MISIGAFLDDVVKRGGTDLHLMGGSPPLARVRGELVPLRELPLESKDLEPLLVELLSAAQRNRLAQELDVGFSFAHQQVARFRASYFFKRGGLGAIFRLIPFEVPSLGELGAPEILWQLAERPSGLVVYAGPASSGKSTTLAAMVDHVAKSRACHVLTIEDPIEFVHVPSERAQITQREIVTHVPTVAIALRNAFRENVDVVQTPELDTAESFRLALELAAAGVLVFATVRTDSVASALERFVSSTPDAEQAEIRELLAATFVGGVAQQLVRAPDGKGKRAVHEMLPASARVSDLLRQTTFDPSALAPLSA